MSAGKYNIYIEKGATFSITLAIKDSLNDAVDLTGHTFRGKIKKAIEDTAAVANFSFSVLDQTEADTRGKVIISLSSAVTETLLAPAKGVSRTLTTMIYDIESVDGGGVVRRWLEGIAEVSPEVTT